MDVDVCFVAPAVGLRVRILACGVFEQAKARSESLFRPVVSTVLGWQLATSGAPDTFLRSITLVPNPNRATTDPQIPLVSSCRCYCAGAESSDLPRWPTVGPSTMETSSVPPSLPSSAFGTRR